MVFWFSGTGNSFAIAKRIAEALGESLIPVAARMAELEAGVWDGLLELAPGERIGFVYPVYAWGPPDMVLALARRLRVRVGGQAGDRHAGEAVGSPFVYAVNTCGDEEGYATSVLRMALKAAALPLDSAFSLRMPNNYILGFDVDPKPVEQDKLRQAEHRLAALLPAIAERKRGVFALLPGAMPGLKTRLVNPMFKRFATNPARFRATEACTACGRCAQVCPTDNIRVDTRPVWGKRCTQCLACIHHCPHRAIEYGKGTENKGRYVHPDAKGMRVR